MIFKTNGGAKVGHIREYKYSYDYTKLNGRIVEKYGTRRAFAESIKLNEAVLSQKLNGNSRFTQDEITFFRNVLDICKEDVNDYFFKTKD